MVVHAARRSYMMGQESGLMGNVIYRPTFVIGSVAFEVRLLAGPMVYSRSLLALMQPASSVSNDVHGMIFEIK
jgi:hypothetical protein